MSSLTRITSDQISDRINGINVSDVMHTFFLLDDAKQSTDLVDGDVVRTFYSNTAAVGDWLYTTSEPSGFYVTAVNGFLKLLTPSFAAAGVITGNYIPSDAWNNRDIITRLLMDTSLNEYYVGTSGVVYVLGSIVPNRSNYSYEIERGAKILGRYDDPSVPDSIGKNTGGMFDMTIRDNYHTTGSTTPTATIENVSVIINGELGTNYNVLHSQTHNNNCIGFYMSRNCVISGSGKIVSSDHRGLNFDGDADNCHIIMPAGSITGCQDEPIVMKCAAERRCTTTIGAVHNVPFGGTNAPIVIRCEGGHQEVTIGTWRWDGVTRPQLVGAFNCQSIKVNPGRIFGVSQALRQYQTVDGVLDGGIFSSSLSLVNVATPVSTRTSTSIKGTKVLDAMESVYYAETTNAIPYSLIVEDNDFSACGTALQFFKGKAAGNIPEFMSWKDNLEPAGMVTPPQGKEWNLLSNIPSSVAAVGLTVITVNLTKNYKYLTVSVSEGATNRRLTLDVVAAYLSSSGYSFIISPTASLVATRSGDVLTLTLSGCTGQNYILHN